ncbi:FadR/GntR family transcriptional regulator [Novosphingobium mangrovi (ex Huang et al. 2023)]|uniref:GntR family transcriptional regulator n=1 Tax=Novosphingobium mangrovi (ex Huang et al. 2023) TaxID=2976432 RepID=A0ABT2I3Z1_9SPHN|nr:FCD domain-containing protein [Novosphingobium mangrovi (ex Huang et al. 2023)]MCT2399297.1 GntR family transcriptional regulator [Novosphingobium mangrovi (ex Huang et al. 2023)]
MSANMTVPRKRGTNLVAATAQVLRERIFAQAPGTLIGSLHDLARSLEVGIVTLQQAARVLEHEGLLEVRRGPGGGYYGARPDDAALERALDAYFRVHPTTYEEALDMTSLLFNELVAAAAGCTDADLRAQLQALQQRLEAYDSDAALGTFEIEFQELLFQMVRRPLFEMLTRVTLHYAASYPSPTVHALAHDIESWKAGRHRIMAAILANDGALARFEADRSNRAAIVRHLHAAQ